MHRKALIIAVMVCGLLIPTLVGEDRLLDRQEGDIPTSDVRKVRIEAEAGWLRVSGQQGASQARYEAEFVGGSRTRLGDLEFDFEQRGDTLHIWTITRNTGWKSNGRINLTLTLPSAVDLEIDDGSGSLEVRGIGGRVDIEDGSGSMVVEDIGSNLEIEDGSGSIEIRQLGGSARIKDGSGSIRLSEAAGDVVISDSSGGIRVSDIRGDFEVLRDGSGGIDYRRVNGEVRLPRNKRGR